jgi:hypothetical protein
MTNISWQRIKQSNTGTVGGNSLSSVRPEVIKGEFTSVASDSSFVIRQSGREDTRSPVRNGVTLTQSSIVTYYNWL